MSVLDIIVSVFGLIASASAVVFAVIAYKRNNKSDNEENGKQNGVVLTEIGYIKSGVDDIKRKQEKQEEHHLEVVTRLTSVEESAKQAHHRIDGLEEKINNI